MLSFAPLNRMYILSGEVCFYNYYYVIDSNSNANIYFSSHLIFEHKIIVIITKSFSVTHDQDPA